MFRGTYKYFKNSLVLTVVGLALGGLVGWYYEGSASGIAKTIFIVAVLGVLEVSLSFDNAVVNATVLKDMTPVWRHRFLTWGIAIAVFGMRLVFPLAVVSIVAHVSPWEALRLAAVEPHEYARILTSAHHVLGAFGGAFLGMVCLKYFFDAEKEVHWIKQLEAWLTKVGKIDAAELGIMLLVIYAFSRMVAPEEAYGFLVSGVFGVITFIAVDGLGSAMEVGPDQMHDVHRASAANFLYLEVLDASFSFDGVIGAFALTHNLFIIAIGLGVGAMFVRSMTIMLVDEGTLGSYRYLEHGAFYAIGALATLMLLGTVMHVPEVITGLIGAAFIALSLWSSLRYNQRHQARRAA